MAATCQGRYHVTGGIAGNVLAIVGQDDEDEDKNKDQDKDKDKDKDKEKDPAFHLCKGLDFSGSISAKLINAVSGPIGRKITRALHQQVCPVVPETVDPVLNAYLDYAWTHWIRPFLKHAGQGHSHFAKHQRGPGAIPRGRSGPCHQHGLGSIFDRVCRVVDGPANAEVNIDYDLNRLENLTLSHLLDEFGCALLPAVQVRLLPGTTNLAFGKFLGANISAAVGGRNFSLSTGDYPQFTEISNDALLRSEEFSRKIVNEVAEKWIRSLPNTCPGVLAPETNRDDDNNDDNDNGRNGPGGMNFTSWGMFLELMIDPFSDTNERYRETKQNTPIDDHIIQEICEEWNQDDAPEGNSEDRSVSELIPEDPPASIFHSIKIPEAIKYLIPATIIGTVIIFISSNSSVGASVDVTVQAGPHSLHSAGLFEFSLTKTSKELYLAGIYPLLILVVCFSGIWPYAKLWLMLHSWMTPCADQHKRERYLLMLDSFGRFSLVDNYVLILFVVAFRFHLGFGDDLDLEVFVSPVYGFYSFLAATCLSLALGHVVLVCHRITMQADSSNELDSSQTTILNHGFRAQSGDSSKRLSRIIQALLVLAMIATMAILGWGFLQESYTFEIGGLAGIMMEEDQRVTSYSVISLGAALPSSVENSRSASVIFLQTVFFFFTVVTPILCLALLLCLITLPLTLKWQRKLLLAAEIARSWSGVEVFLLSILAALFQISTFASFMIGDKCDLIDSIADKILDEHNADVVCFSVDAYVESNSWYLLVAAFANFLLVSFCLRFAEDAVDEKMRGPPVGQTESPTSEVIASRTFAQLLIGIPIVGRILFVTVPNINERSEEDVTPLED
eukprot:jgi/Psemu1/325071/estExt_fgenesh1_pg.C_2000022